MMGRIHERKPAAGIDENLSCHVFVFAVLTMKRLPALPGGVVLDRDSAPTRDGPLGYVQMKRHS